MKSLFELINDYRDSIFYSLTIIVCVALYAGGFQSLRDTGELLTDATWCREFCRMMAWGTGTIRNESYYRVAYFATVITNLGQFVFDANTLSGFYKHPALGTIFFIVMSLQFLSAALIVWLAGGVKPILKSYWKNLFDWPRKQKPPKHRWETAKRKIADALEKFRPDFIPSPAGC